ncbi:hypothetical protein GOP47_0011263 [Adiantum capillus-veneris]|uniref:Amino acid transporter transmembrane domain-containing protein n=1 Tax=Adiantum capillus-veneris TaxID=13818 RepID=A0A9D4USU5_ADICA|nr:hypothetical protein GOP47_0011263 [Adiantum capillus-veneris]
MEDVEMEVGKAQDSSAMSESALPSLPHPGPSKGTWLHAGYHLTTGTAGASTPNLPAALAGLGWGPGVFFLTMFAIASYYAYYLLILILDRFEKTGRRYQHYGEVSKELIGRRWTIYAVAPLQFVVCFTTVVSFVLLGGQSLKAICYDYSQPSMSLRLPMFIVIFGIASTILSQTPTFHSLRHLNLVSFVSSLAYAAIVVSGSIIAHYSKDKPIAVYSVLGSNRARVMNAFNALSILSTMFGNALVVETQATISSPIKDNMVRGLHLCYVATITTFFSVAITGYWAFGNSSNSNIFLSMVSDIGTTYIPSWMFILGNLSMIVQLIAGSVLYSQPTFEIIDNCIQKKTHNYSQPIFFKIILRLILRTCFMMLATLLAAMLPFFGDFNAIVGALGYMPLVFIYPIIFYLKFFEVPPLSVNFSIHLILLLIFASATIIGIFASIRQFILDENTFKIFANL